MLFLDLTFPLVCNQHLSCRSIAKSFVYNSNKFSVKTSHYNSSIVISKKENEIFILLRTRKNENITRRKTSQESLSKVLVSVLVTSARFLLYRLFDLLNWQLWRYFIAQTQKRFFIGLISSRSKLNLTSVEENTVGYKLNKTTLHTRCKFSAVIDAYDHEVFRFWEAIVPDLSKNSLLAWCKNQKMKHFSISRFEMTNTNPPPPFSTTVIDIWNAYFDGWNTAAPSSEVYLHIRRQVCNTRRLRVNPVVTRGMVHPENTAYIKTLNKIQDISLLLCYGQV